MKSAHVRENGLTSAVDPGIIRDLMSGPGKGETMFKVGEKVVYPAHGVGVIQSIQTRVVSGTEKTFYMLRIMDSDMTIMISTENVASVGLRRGIGKEMGTKVYKDVGEERGGVDQKSWKPAYAR